MKNMIVTIAAVVLICNLLMFQKDTSNLVWTMENIKYISDEMARTASLHIDEEDWASGEIAFEARAGNDKAKAAYEGAIKDLSKRAGHFLFDKDKMKYYITFVDSQNGIVTFDEKNNVLRRERLLEDDQEISLYCQNKTVQVSKGTVLVEIDCKNANYSLRFLRSDNGLRCFSIYEYVH